MQDTSLSTASMLAVSLLSLGAVYLHVRALFEHMADAKATTPDPAPKVNHKNGQ